MFNKRLKNKTWVGKYFIPERYITDLYENDTVEGLEVTNGLSGFSCKMFVAYPTDTVLNFIPYTGTIDSREILIAYNTLTDLYNKGEEHV